MCEPAFSKSKFFLRSLAGAGQLAKNRGMKFAGLLVVLVISVGFAAGQQPTIRQNQGVENAASYTTSNPPGSLVAIFGSNLSGETLLASSTPLTAQIQSKTETISVTVNGKASPMFYATPNQASVQLPMGDDCRNRFDGCDAQWSEVLSL